MPKERIVELDQIPAPGEPLQKKIAPQNEELIREELEYRAKMLGAKLSKRELKRVKRRYNSLWRKLHKSRFNALLTEYNALLKEYNILRKAYLKSPKPELKAQISSKRKEGRAKMRLIHELEPLLNEFNELKDRLTLHEQAVSYELEDAANRAAFLKEVRTWEAQIRAVFRQSARLHHRYTDANGKWVIDIPDIERIVFKDDKVLFQIATTRQSLIEKLFGRWHSALPYDVDVTDITCDETLENLSTACNRIVTVERSKAGTNLFYVLSRMDSPDGIPLRVMFSKVISWYPAKDHSKTPWAGGVGNDRKVLWYDFESMPHVLIAGSTQSGKSNHVNQMIATLVTMNSPDELRLMLVDLKGGIEFTHWAGLKHSLRPMAKSPDEVLETLKFMRRIMEKRLAAFESIKAKNLASYNQKIKKRLPRIVCLIDEMATLLGLDDLTHEIHNELRVLSSQGRAVGVHLVLCTQHSSVDVLPGWVKTNMTLRISGKMPSITASQVILDTATAATLPNVPGRLVFSAGRYEDIAQSPFITDEEISRAVRVSQAFPAPDNSEFEKSEIIVKPKFSKEDLIDIALEQFDGRLSARVINETLGNELAPRRHLQQMIDELVLAGQNGITHDGEKYSIKKIRTTYCLVATQPVTQESAAVGD